MRKLASIQLERHIVSLSGGKDSTAMLLMMLERGMQVDHIVFCDTGMEFPEMYTHLKKLKEYIGRDIEVITPPNTYEFYLGHKVKRSGKIGYGHPDFRNRWCTALLKRDPFIRFLKKFKGFKVVEYHGIAFDEKERASKNNRKGEHRDIRYPLIDFCVTESEALSYCYSKGFTWDGLYNTMGRVSCWCCPLSRIGELRVLFRNFPNLWEKLVELDKLSFRRFRSDYTLTELTDRFQLELDREAYEKTC